MPDYPMALEATHIIAYQQNVQMLAQQMQIPILEAVTRIEGSGLAMSVADYFEPSEYAEQEARTRRNAEMQIDAKRRFVFHRKDIINSGYIDKEDKLRAAQDPTSPLMTNRLAAVRRGIHDRIVGIKKKGARFIVDPAEGRGILGKATEGAETPISTVTLPGSQTIVHGSAGLTLDKLIEAQERLNLADFGMEDDDPLYALISPKQITDLINLAAETEGALNPFMQQQLITGKPTSLMGITWIRSNRVPHTSATGDPVRMVPVWSKKNIPAAFWEDIQGTMWNDTHADNKPFQKVWANLDATRHQDGGVIVIECSE
ncbi:phage capsid protein [Pararhodobacter sp.]|uniref:phage capsid protein n=1 Tax=Pararhodobacter sp. TaxID=2127056 RepID=UPI002FDE727A